MLDELINKLESLEPNKLISGRLKEGDCFCVLGHLADLLVENGIGKWEESGYCYNNEPLYTHFLPMKVLSIAGLTYQEASDLIEINDDKRYSHQPSKRLHAVLSKLKRIKHDKGERHDKVRQAS